MLSTHPPFAPPGPLGQDVQSLLDAHSLSASHFNADCRDGYRWRGRAMGWAELIDSLLARRFVTSLLLVGLPALVIATLV